MWVAHPSRTLLPEVIDLNVVSQIGLSARFRSKLNKREKSFSCFQALKALQNSHFALRCNSLACRVGGTASLADAFHCFNAALERLCAALTEEFQTGLLGLRNTLGGMFPYKIHA